MLHVVHPLAPDLWVQAHRRCQQVWIFHGSVLRVPQRAVSCSLPTCCFVAGKVRNLINKVRSRVGRARPPGLLIPPDIRVLMNVLSWSREYCRKLCLLPPLPWSYQGYLTWLSRERGAIAAGRRAALRASHCTAAWGVCPVPLPSSRSLWLLPFPSLPPRAA